MLEKLDLTKEVKDKAEYEAKLEEYQLRMLVIQSELKKRQIPLLLMFEGPDASGKGGAIKRLTEQIDPRGYEVHSIAAPNSQELSHHYLRRFWLRIPPKGKIGIFDRSWYGRVLVERVEGFATKEEWHRAYAEINNFEKVLVDNGTILIKFYIHISKEEQLKRFKERETNPYKQWKITEEDYRNREKWDDYIIATEDMLERNNPDFAPWTLVEGNRKWHARLKVMKTAINTAEDRLGISTKEVIQEVLSKRK